VALDYQTPVHSHRKLLSKPKVRKCLEEKQIHGGKGQILSEFCRRNFKKGVRLKEDNIKIDLNQALCISNGMGCAVPGQYVGGAGVADSKALPKI
jgi:hypothetical protein